MSSSETNEHLIKCLTDQLEELEILKSIYPNNDEIVLTDKNIIESIQEFIKNQSDYTPSHLDFVINLRLDRLKLEVCVNLPSFYPNEEPTIYVRCNQLNRQQETKLNSKLSEYITNNHLNQVCIFTMITWLQENIESFSAPVNNAKCYEAESPKEKNNAQNRFVRYWIYSHHIYNKKKRDEIVKRARDLNVNGFCLAGKPGTICIEGLEHDCQEWWKDIKALTWKKIAIRKIEYFRVNEQKKEQKFNRFDEIYFQHPTPKHNKHADISGLSKFLEERGLSKEFNEFFGICSEYDNKEK